MPINLAIEMKTTEFFVVSKIRYKRYIRGLLFVRTTLKAVL